MTRNLKREIFINADGEETRVAVLEDERLVEINIERPEAERAAGNVYKAKVENVLPGMQAAFVNIGLEKNAFLYVADAAPVVNPEEVEGDAPPKPRKGMAINKLLKPGQKIIVQVTKDPIGTKGARVSAYVTLPSHYVVLMPTVDYVGVSRRIADPKERARLRTIASKVKPRGMGLIVRTAAEGRTHDDIQADVEYLHNIWKKIRTRATGGTVPRILHQDLGLVGRMVRDVLTENVTRVVVDSPAEYEMVKELLDAASVGLRDRIEMHDRRNGEIFTVYGIEAELDRAIQRRVWLKSGGYLVIDETEAFTVFDVNTGRYVGSTSLAQTVLDTNLEAAAEIARQLRLRDIGGIVVIDFIDMDVTEHRQKVIACLEEHLKRDRTRSHVLGLTQLGLVEMTRKKVKQSLGDMMTKLCPICEGRGRILSAETVAARVRREMREVLHDSESQGLLIEVHPDVASLLIGTGGQRVRELEKELGKAVYIRGSDEQHQEGYKFRLLDSRADAQAAATPVQVGDVIELRVEEQHSSSRKDGIARVEGFTMDIEDGGDRVGERVKVEVTKVHKTFARSRIIGPERPPRSDRPDAPGPIEELHDARRRAAAILAATARRTAQATPSVETAEGPKAAVHKQVAQQDTQQQPQQAAEPGGATGGAAAPAKRSRSRRRRPRKPAAQAAQGQSAAEVAEVNGPVVVPGEGAVPAPDAKADAAKASSAKGSPAKGNKGRSNAAKAAGAKAAGNASVVQRAESETAAATEALVSSQVEGQAEPSKAQGPNGEPEANGEKPKRKSRRRRGPRRKKPRAEDAQPGAAADVAGTASAPGAGATAASEPIKQAPVAAPNNVSSSPAAAAGDTEAGQPQSQDAQGDKPKSRSGGRRPRRSRRRKPTSEQAEVQENGGGQKPPNVDSV